MKITFDEKADALYIQFQNGKSKKTVKLQEGILVDIGKNDKLFGIEILDATHRIPLKQIGHLDINMPVCA